VISGEPDSLHIQLPVLWEFSKNLRTLASSDEQHLLVCENCIGVLGICRGAKTIEHAKEILTRTAIPLNRLKKAMN
jgi:hypothetical protein